MNKLIVLTIAGLLLAFSTVTFGQAEKVKGKAKNLKRQVESGQTNKAPATNSPPRTR